jgi:hypothetical protein
MFIYGSYGGLQDKDVLLANILFDLDEEIVIREPVDPGVPEGYIQTPADLLSERRV